MTAGSGNQNGTAEAGGRQRLSAGPLPIPPRARTGYPLGLTQRGPSIRAHSVGQRVIEITDSIRLDEGELSERFIRAPGPGGQKVNKVSTAVQLQFDVARSPSLPEDTRQRLIALAGRRVSREGVLTITAHRHRTRERNRQDALDRLVELIRRASVRRPPRKATRPTRASMERRLAQKRERAALKRTRADPRSSD